ncbi:hypothetical protein N7470_005205 [Penicillium chermesinum]|nr:hypothetical protein N7470_005205 [Penicillium chermesinum]
MSAETPGPDAEMLSPIPKRRGGGQAQPQRALLSVYYASTRRSKLTKVGAFLEKRVAKDVWRRRLGNVQVALHIVTALIEKVPRDLPIYARSVLTIIETVLKSNDISMVEDSLETFETFCHHQDIAIIAAEQDIAHKYREVVNAYAGFADPTSASYSSSKPSPPVAIRWRNAGLRAIKSVVSTESLAADGGTSLKLIIPVILANVYSPTEDVLIPLKAKLRETETGEGEGVRAHRISAADVPTLDTADGNPAQASLSTADNDRQAEMDARLLALRCLEKIIVSGSNRGQIRIAASTILRFIAKQKYEKYEQASGDASHEKAQAGNWATTLIELVANWCPVQVRFVILMTAMDILLETTPKEDALDSSYTILSAVDWLLKSSVNMIGLSVMDILLGLMQYASNILSPVNIETEKKKPEEKLPIFTSIFAPRKALLTLLERSIGDLATHIYYGDQVPDMIRAILRRYKPTTNESMVQSALATVHETGGEPADLSQSTPAVEVPREQTYLIATAKITSFRAVKAILEVANSTCKPSTAASEVRNPVGIYVWEGTQGLLRDPDRGVRFAYADAFLSWLELETNKDDLKVRVDLPKIVRPPSKRDAEQTDKATRRSTSAPGHQREKVALAAQSIFLRLLHLAIYDSAIDSASSETEILFLHLVLASLVDHLGVNAVQYGLPMILKLQDDSFMDIGSYASRINVGSLVHGYLLAVSEKFNLESTTPGIEIQSEINRRRKDGHWLSSIRLPPAQLNEINMDDEKPANGHAVTPHLKPFQNLDGLVDGIEESYRQFPSPPQSPPASPSARGFSFPVLNAPPPQNACLASVEQESAKTLSLSGSRGGTLARNSNANGVNGSPAGSGAKDNRRLSVPEGSRTPEPSSGRSSPVRATTLRRVLSVNVDSNNRRRSPLRDHVKNSNASISSGSDSMISGNSSISDADGEVLVLPEDEDRGDRQRRPSASAIALSGEKNPPMEDNNPSGVDSDDDIPPRSTNPHNPRPSTAPDNPQPSSNRSKHGQTHERHANSLSRNKSRSSHNLNSASEPFQGLDFNSDKSESDQLRLLLDSAFVPSNGILTNGDRLHTASSKDHLPRSFSTRRHLNGGIGRPPY